MNSLYLAGGCFWGLEALLRTQPGVIDTEVGYCGGENDNPTYSFHPGHAETVRVDYDPLVTSAKALLEYFFSIHNPTTINQQGNDKGSAYRSVIFVQSEEERALAQEVIQRVNQSHVWKDPVVTTLEPFTVFHPAEPEHQDYLERNPHGYTCHLEYFDVANIKG